jgi:Fe-S-cluster-containing dehydrogenase component
MTRLGMLIDLRTCIGCHACSIACKSEFDVPLGVFRDTVKYVEEGVYPKAKRHFIPVLCNHCEDAPCLDACPTAAISRLDDGQVVINKGDCNTNRFCMAACPYGAIYVDPEENVAQKCTFCEHRTSQGMQPACVDACPTKCRIFGDLDDPTTAIAQKAHANATRVWKPEAGTRPKVLYIDPHDALPLIAGDGVQVPTVNAYEAGGDSAQGTWSAPTSKAPPPAPPAAGSAAPAAGSAAPAAGSAAPAAGSAAPAAGSAAPAGQK